MRNWTVSVGTKQDLGESVLVQCYPNPGQNERQGCVNASAWSLEDGWVDPTQTDCKGKHSASFVWYDLCRRLEACLSSKGPRCVGPGSEVSTRGLATACLVPWRSGRFRNWSCIFQPLKQDLFFLCLCIYFSKCIFFKTRILLIDTI